MPVTKAGKASLGQKRTSSAGFGIVAANEASRLRGGGGGDVCCLQQPSTASGVRSGGARWAG